MTGPGTGTGTGTATGTDLGTGTGTGTALALALALALAPGRRDGIEQHRKEHRPPPRVRVPPRERWLACQYRGSERAAAAAASTSTSTSISTSTITRTSRVTPGGMYRHQRGKLYVELGGLRRASGGPSLACASPSLLVVASLGSHPCPCACACACACACGTALSRELVESLPVSVPLPLPPSPSSPFLESAPPPPPGGYDYYRR